VQKKKIEKPPSTWDLHYIGRGENDSKSAYPILDSNVKAAHTKPVLFYLSELATEIASHCKCTFDFITQVLQTSYTSDFLLEKGWIGRYHSYIRYMDIHTPKNYWCKWMDGYTVFATGVSHAILGTGCTNRAIMLWGVCDFLWVCDRPDLFLGDYLKKRGHDSGRAALLAYGILSHSNLQSGRVNYKIRPKWNPRWEMVFVFCFGASFQQHPKTNRMVIAVVIFFVWGPLSKSAQKRVRGWWFAGFKVHVLFWNHVE